MTRFRTKLAAAVAGLTTLFAPACAQQRLPTPVASEMVPVEQVGRTGPALWKVADEDTTIWLFGTVHALPKDVDWYDGTIAEALAGSDMLVTEILTDADTPKRTQEAILSRAVLPEGQTLRAMLDAEQTERYEAALARLEMPPGSFDRFEPWYAAMMFSMLPLLKQGYLTDAGVEKVLDGNAGTAKPRGELETIESQLAIFDELPMDARLDYLMEAVDASTDIKALLDAMVAEWLEGDADELAVLMNADMTDPVLMEKLLYARNRAWAEWIDKRLEQPGTVFVAVGAGHLAGAKSVQDALRDRGIATTRVQ